MITMDILKEFGADTQEGLDRCLGNEDFYLKMVNMGIGDDKFEALGTALQNNDLDEAFELAHAIKGVLGNLALTPIYEPAGEMTELLRTRTEMDYTQLYNKVMEERSRLLSMV
ncbi:MAG: Hpt domain-containing protein [Lachnospiraceae bacterium]|nr:Hpt domain-containing protein [Lachnospiraceae bacterium]